MGILRAARMPDHVLAQSDIESLLLAAHKQKRSAGALIAYDEAPPDMSSAGRYALSHLAAILRSLVQIAPDVWSLLAQYLFIETTIMRDLLAESEGGWVDSAPPGPVGRDKSGPTRVPALRLAFPSQVVWPTLRLEEQSYEGV